ncbi:MULTISPECIES: TIGR01841 family phasin [Caballeronia]|jgi:phasin family protein|uniref:Phasin n=1 Tax=Caballeronia telluris TaxID=326475 RepID=A0A158EPK2_9BURK|nr:MULTISPECIES: TIGR01841 family phasin [Caballeronia]MDR5754535.1 TIGR01841 family phasin [Caballeronia sp. LZ024]MDR5839506.1 TIGR01841 family phasin [Caballeronia sp. LZ031]SAL09485.1 phasin [Caballeronia telluris]
MAEQTNPFGDLTKMLEQFKVPGVDMSALMESRKKDIEAIVEANKSAYDSMQAVARKQTEMLTRAMQDIQAAATAGADPTKHTEVARNACVKALEDIKDLAEIARKSQTDAMTSITQRANEHMEEIKKMLQRK